MPYLQLGLLTTFFLLKFCAKQGIRHFFKPIARWDNFNAYIKERLFFEHFESFEQLKHISLDNRRHIASMLDISEIQFSRIVDLINKNLH